MPRPAPMAVGPVTLEGELVRLEPLSLDHLDDLVTAGLRPGVFRWFLDPVDSADGMREFVEGALANQAAGSELPFATIERVTGKAVGSTRFLNIDRTHHRLEIGYTWVTTERQGAGLNTEAKLLQLTHAFEDLGCMRVEFKTDSLNERSRGALLGIGSSFEGIFRDHMIRHDGTHRHSAYYSVVEGEWPAVKAGLQARLKGQRTSTMR
jgi:N-acetyltransferase